MRDEHVRVPSARSLTHVYKSLADRRVRVQTILYTPQIPGMHIPVAFRNGIETHHMMVSWCLKHSSHVAEKYWK